MKRWGSQKTDSGGWIYSMSLTGRTYSVLLERTATVHDPDGNIIARGSAAHCHCSVRQRRQHHPQKRQPSYSRCRWRQYGAEAPAVLEERRNAHDRRLPEHPALHGDQRRVLRRQQGNCEQFDLPGVAVPEGGGGAGTAGRMSNGDPARARRARRLLAAMHRMLAAASIITLNVEPTN